jgi:hypothetical protein
MLMGLYYLCTSRIISFCLRCTSFIGTTVVLAYSWRSILSHHPYCTTIAAAKEIIPPTIVPTCNHHLLASSKVKGKAHIISSWSIMDTPIHARMPDAPKCINVHISTNISSCLRVSMSQQLASLTYVSDASLTCRPIMPMDHLSSLCAPGWPPSLLPPSH